MKVAVYARVSTEEQDVNKQESICRDWCNHNKHEIYDVYKDVVSGSKVSRPEFNRLLNDMRQYKFKAVVVTRLDRMGRSLQHLLSILDELNKKGIEFIATTQNIDTTSAVGRLQWHIMGAFAEFERELISERTKEGLNKSPKRALVGKRGKDKKPRKKGGYYLRYSSKHKI